MFIPVIRTNSNYSQKGRREISQFHKTLQQILAKKLFEATQGNRENARHVMEEYAKTHLIESEHQKLAEMSDNNLLAIVTNMTIEDPEGMGAFLEAAKEATNELNQQSDE